MTPLLKDRRRAQAGTTLVELLVSLTIVGLALVLIMGTLSTGLLNAVLAKRNTASQAVMQYELDSILASQFSSSASQYSECFATESSIPPAPAAGYQQPCPSGAYSLRADVSWSSLSATAQQWTVTVTTWPGGAQVGSPVQVDKVNK